jgi:two-component system, OmpR family, KDP operon response regulator KdpE
MTRVLVVDDDAQLIRVLRVNLEARLFEVTVAMTGRQAIDAAGEPLDAVLLDLGLPDMDGVSVVRALRESKSVPIIILSGRSQTPAKVEALNAGADDYVTKPFQIEELVARLRAAVRRAAIQDDEQSVVRIGASTIDLQAQQVTTRDTETGQMTVIHLTKTEWQLLRVLVRHPGRLISAQELMRAVRGPDVAYAPNYLRQYVAQLRSKLEPNPARPRYLLTEPGMGYRLQLSRKTR